MNYRFNYIITIHNKEALLGKVLEGVVACAGAESRVFAVLDGCTDGSESVVDSFAGKVPIPIVKIKTPDVHELRTINAGLRAADHSGDGFNIILQDDVVLEDSALERKLSSLYEWRGSQLAYVSLRLGADFAEDVMTSNSSVPYRHYVENAHGHGIRGAEVLMPGRFAQRAVAIKSPVCLPFWAVRHFTEYDESLAPYGHDDLELSLRLLEAGYVNGVFGVRFSSRIEWGGTRTSPHPELDQIITRNMQRLRERYGPALERAARATPRPNQISIVPGQTSSHEDSLARAAWKRHQRELSAFSGRGPYRLNGIVKKLRGRTRS